MFSAALLISLLMLDFIFKKSNSKENLLLNSDAAKNNKKYICLVIYLGIYLYLVIYLLQIIKKFCTYILLKNK